MNIINTTPEVNHVRIAVDRIGGPTKTSLAMGVSGTAVHAWMRKGKISNIDIARKVAELSEMTLQQLRPTL